MASFHHSNPSCFPALPVWQEQKALGCVLGDIVFMHLVDWQVLLIYHTEMARPRLQPLIQGVLCHSKFNILLYSVIYRTCTAWTTADVSSWTFDLSVSVNSSLWAVWPALCVCSLPHQLCNAHPRTHTADLKHWHSSGLLGRCLRCVGFHNTQQSLFFSRWHLTTSTTPTLMV